MRQTFYSNGKLLLTGEYLVLDGAKALALPTKMGQNLQVVTHDKPTISWKSFDADGTIWFEDELELDAIINYKEAAESSVKNTLLTILHHAHLLQPSFFQETVGYQIETALTFPKKWGLGTSSTLINNLAQWLKIDAFELLNNSFGGSGYDIAVAQEKSAILYQNNPRLIEKVEFKPKFAKDLILIHLNQKQDSREGIAAFRSREKSIYLRNLFSEITKKVLECEKIEDFSELMLLQERELSKFLNVKMIKDKCFKDCPSFVKSLGAWGGDFVLASKFGDYKKYFSHNNYHNVFDWESLVY
jgi:mevalonate kinase